MWSEGYTLVHRAWSTESGLGLAWIGEELWVVARMRIDSAVRLSISHALLGWEQRDILGSKDIVRAFWKGGLCVGLRSLMVCVPPFWAVRQGSGKIRQADATSEKEEEEEEVAVGGARILFWGYQAADPPYHPPSPRLSFHGRYTHFPQLGVWQSSHSLSLDCANQKCIPLEMFGTAWYIAEEMLGGKVGGETFVG